MAATLATLEAAFPYWLARLINEYFKPWPLLGPVEIGRSGNYERALMVSDGDINYVLRGACEGGHVALTNYAISRGANDWDYALEGADLGGAKSKKCVCAILAAIEASITHIRPTPR